MRITADVALPEAVVEAARDGELVLFVGAGVSLNAPSSLPSFAGLAEMVASRAGIAADPREPADAFLGRLASEFAETKHVVREIIGQTSSKPNAAHTAIARLAHAAKCPIVTTNYDEHITTAAESAGIDLGDVFTAPAVPLARTFSGVVHLHGAVSRSTTELVVTDEDFGRAYLTDGWARRFVQDLFTNRTVLFVGYSHADVVITYLARGLPPNTRRYVLTHEPESQRWTDLRITPIGYPPDGDHRALSHALDEWAQLHAMDNLDHHERVREIARGLPPKTPAEADYITYALSVPSGVHSFAASATGEPWLRWAEAHPVFATLFDPSAELSEAARTLMNWFTGTYIADPTQTSFAMSLFARQGPFVNARLRHAVAFTCARMKAEQPVLAYQWALVVSSAMSTDQQVDEIWHNPFREALSGPQLLPLLRRALVPRLVLKEERPWFPVDEDDRPSRLKAEITWPLGEYEAQHLWESVRADFAPLTPAILQIVEQAVLDGHDMLAAFDPDRFDSWSFRRSAIEPHPQDEHRDTQDNLTDALRDAGVVQQSLDKSIRPRWLASPYPLMRRVGVHLLAEDPSATPGEKLRELLDASLLYDHHLLHEVFRLVSIVVPSLDPRQREDLLNAILVGPPPFNVDAETEARYHERGIFDLLEWTSRFVDDWPELSLKIEAVRERRPDMGVRPHPDFSSWMESGTWGGSAPMETDDFVVLVDTAGPSAAMRSLLDRDYSERDFHQPTIRDACQVLTAAVQSRPHIAPGLLQLLLSPVWLRQQDLLYAVLRGWAEAELDDDTAAAAVAAAIQLLPRGDLLHPIANLCRSLVDNDTTRSPAVLERTDELASSIWTQFASSFEAGGWNDPFTAALNTWPGFIAQYWVHRIRVRWRMTEPWEGLSEREQRAITGMLTESGPATEPASSIFFAELNFLHAADPAFTESALLPRFDIAREEAVLAWNAYLHGGRTSPQLLDAGLWDRLVNARAMFPPSTDQADARRYWAVLAAVAVDSPAEVINRSELIATLSLSSHQQELASFLRNLAVMMSDADPRQIESVWAWVEPAWTERIASGTGAQSPEERSAWSDLALELRDLAPIAVALSDQAPGAFTSRTRYSEINASILQEHADLFARNAHGRVKLLVTADWHVEHQLSELVEIIRKHARPEVIRELAEEALSVGVHIAAEWITDAR